MSDEKACLMCEKEVDIFHNEMCKRCYDSKVLYDYITGIHQDNHSREPASVIKYYQDDLETQVNADLVQGNLKQYYFNKKLLRFELFREEHKGDYDLDIQCRFTIKLQLPDKPVYQVECPNYYNSSTEQVQYQMRHSQNFHAMIYPLETE